MEQLAAMVKMPTYRRNSHFQAGLTLTELLIMLAVLSVITSGVTGIWLQRSLPGLAVRSALSTLEADLKQARLHARTDGVDVFVEYTNHHYHIEALGKERKLAKNLKIEWNTALPFAFPSSPPYQGGRITISNGGQVGEIIIDPLTGKVSRK